MFFSVVMLFHTDLFYLDDESGMCDPVEEGTGGIQDAGWETYWGKDDDMRITSTHTVQ